MQYCKHRQGGLLYEVCDLGNGYVELAPQGGGFMRRLTQDQFERNFERVTPDLTYTAGTVTAEFLPEGVILPCYSNGMRWNGWGMPVFAFEAACRLMALNPEITYDAQRDCFTWKPHDDDEQDTFEAAMIDNDGRPVKVYAIGAGSWCWDAVQQASLDARDEGKWNALCNEHGWNEQSQILHLEGFLRDRNLFSAFVEYAKRAAEDETSQNDAN